MTSIHTNVTQTTEDSPVRNEILNELREQVHDIIRSNQRSHIYFANNNLYKVVVKGPRGFYIAERKVRALREEGL